MQNALMEFVDQLSVRGEIPEFEIGDTVDVHVRILEGEKERIQIFNGVVIARSGGGIRETFIVRRIVQGEGVERIFPVHSPRIAKVVVKRSGKVRRAKLYYLRELSGKAVRLKERFKGGKATTEEARAAKQKRRQERIEAKKAKKARKEQRKAEGAGESTSAASTALEEKQAAVTESQADELNDQAQAANQPQVEGQTPQTDSSEANDSPKTSS